MHEQQPQRKEPSAWRAVATIGLAFVAWLAWDAWQDAQRDANKAKRAVAASSSFDSSRAVERHYPVTGGTVTVLSVPMPPEFAGAPLEFKRCVSFASTAASAPGVSVWCENTNVLPID